MRCICDVVLQCLGCCSAVFVMSLCCLCDSVPLKSISVEVLVQDHVATVSSTLQYVNEEERPLEALFVLPLPADAAVCHFSAKTGEQEIVAEVQDRETVSPNTNQKTFISIFILHITI